MKKLIIFISLGLLIVNFAFAGEELTVLWEKSVTQATKPAWFDTENYTRGFSYGLVDGQERLYVVSRFGGSFIYILDATTGDSLGKLDNTGIIGGTYHVSDVGVSEDSVIFVCNLALGGTFKIYKWTEETAAPVEVINYDATDKRLGDKISVTGAASDNSLVIWAASVTSNEVVKFTTVDNGATFTAEVIDIGMKGGSASVGLVTDGSGDFYYNATGVHVYKFTATGTQLGAVPGSVVSTGSNSIRFLTTMENTEYFVTFQYGANNENARVVKVPDGDLGAASTYSLTPTLGSNSNANGTGDVSVKANDDGSFTVFVLSTNNGLGAYQVKFPTAAMEAVNLTLNWDVNTDDYPFFKNDNNTRGIGYNPATNHVLVAARTGGPVIYALDATNGAIADTLDMTGVSGGVIPLMKVVADVNGVVYACNLALAGGEFKVYRWADENAVPTVAFAGIVTGRTGDAMNLAGADTATILYASGSGSPEIVLLTTSDGENFTPQTPIPVAVGTARGGIAPITDNLDSDLWINGTGTTLRHIDNDGTILSEIDGGIVASSWMNVDYIQAANGAKLLAVNANNVTSDIRKLQVWDITESETNPTLWATGETGYFVHPNANGAGEIIAHDNGDGTYTLFQLTTNNAIASWTLMIPEVVDLLTIAEAKVDADNDFVPDLLNLIVSIKGVISSPNYGSHSQYYLQDETAGIVLYSSSIDLALNIGDEVQITGEITQYRGISQIEPATAEDVLVLSTNNKLAAKKIKIPEISEPNEALLVQVDSVWLVDVTQWPTEGRNGNVDITDGVDTTYIFIDKETDLDGWTPPTGMINLIAVVDQYTSATPPNTGYSLRGTLQEHFVELMPILTIAEAKADTNNDFVPDLLDSVVTIKGIINSPNYGYNTQYYLQDETAGIVLYSGSVPLTLKMGDEVQITGKITQYRGISEIEPATAEDVKVLSSDNFVKPKIITIPQMDESVEALLVQMDSVWIVDMSQWPATGKNGNVDITDGKDTTYIFIDKETDLDGWMPPSGKMTIIAVIDQYTQSIPPNDGYSLRGTIKEHFIDLTPIIPPEPMFPLWAKTQAAGTFPTYMSTQNYTRGMAYGNVGGQDRVYVLTRFGPHRIVIYDAMTGDSLGVIDKPSQAEGVGLFHLNCVDVSEDGLIFACNMTLGSDATHPFRVYRWDNETAEAVTVISLDTGLGRLGDMFSVYGSAADNSLTIYAGIANSNKLVKFSTSDNGVTFTPEVITLATGDFGTVPNIAQANDGTLYIKSYGRALVHINPDGTLIDTISTEVVGTGSSKIQYHEYQDKKYVVAYYPDLNGTMQAEKMTVVDLTDPTQPNVVYESPSIGNVANGNGTGSVDLKQVNDETMVFFIMGTNNGVAAFTNNSEFVIGNLDTLFYGDSPVLHENPYGSGFITGTNGYGDLGKYQRFDFKPGDELFGFKCFFAHKEIVDTPDSLDLVVKTVRADGAPGALVARMKVTTAALDTTLTGNTFFLDYPLTVEAPLFIGFEFTPGSNDTIAIYADANGEGNGANRAWEQTGPDAFQSLNDPGDWSWHLDADLWIAAYYKKATVTSLEELVQQVIPLNYELSQNYPNPFNPKTKFHFAVPKQADVKIVVFNALGQQVAKIFDGTLPAGVHHFEFDGSQLASGMYFYQVKAEGVNEIKRMMLVK